MAFDPRFQEEKNGPLSKGLRDRISAFRSHFTLAEIGKELGFSGPFVSQILREPNPQRVDSKHIPRILKALEDGERRNAKLMGLNVSPSKAPTPITPAPTQNSLDYHLAAIDSLGWTITGLTRK